MANANVNIGVKGVSEFKRNMKDAESSVKALTSSLELNKKELEATGNKENYLKNQTQILKDAIEAQTAAVQASESALNQMRKDGVVETSSAFNNMKKRVNESRIKLLDLKAELKKVETQSGDTSTGLENIGKNVAWDNVAEGIGKIADRLQGAARAAANFGKRIGRSVMSSAEWADNLKTTADQFDITPERLQRMQNVADIIDTDVEAILGAQQRMAKAATTKKGISAIEETLGIGLNGQSADDLFWEIGDALVNMSQGFDKEAAAQSIFGRSWRELLPLFKAGREEYEKMLEEQKVMSDEDVNRLGALDDTINVLKQQIELTKNQFIADNADKITELLQWIVDNKDGVVTALTAIGGGFAALKMAELAANVAKVVSGLQGLGWIKGGSDAAKAVAGAGGGTAGLALGLTAGVAAMPAFAAYIAANAIPDEYKLGKEERVVSATYSKEELLNLRQWVELQNELYEIESKYGTTSFNEDRYAELNQTLAGMNVQSGDLWGKYWDYLVANGITPGNGKLPADFLDQMISESIGGTPEIHAEPVLTDNAGAALQQQLSSMSFSVPVVPAFSFGGNQHANGLPWVPFDGYPAFLHRGERVMTAGENRHYTYNSNTYFGNVNLNNGMDIDNLVNSIDRNNRRKNAGYGG